MFLNVMWLILNLINELNRKIITIFDKWTTHAVDDEWVCEIWWEFVLDVDFDVDIEGDIWRVGGRGGFDQ